MTRDAAPVAAAVVVSGTLLVSAHRASATETDDCNDGYFKESDGYLGKQGLWEGAAGSGRNATIYHSGRVRFCRTGSSTTTRTVEQ